VALWRASCAKPARRHHPIGCPDAASILGRSVERLVLVKRLVGHLVRRLVQRLVPNRVAVLERAHPGRATRRPVRPYPDAVPGQTGVSSCYVRPEVRKRRRSAQTGRRLLHRPRTATNSQPCPLMAFTEHQTGRAVRRSRLSRRRQYRTTTSQPAAEQEWRACATPSAQPTSLPERCRSPSRGRSPSCAR
jgi:hypothetical protein